MRRAGRDIAVKPLSRPAADGSAHRAPPILTPRQSRVLALVRLGQSNKEIAAVLGISEQGAKVHVSKLLRKFGAVNRASLVAAADDLGLGE